MPSADCCTDHRPVRCKVASTRKSPPKWKGPLTKKLQVHKFRDPRVTLRDPRVTLRDPRTSSVEKRRQSVVPHIIAKPLYTPRTEVPCRQTRKPSSSAGQSNSKASSATYAPFLHWPRFPKGMCSWIFMIHPLEEISRKPQCS